MDGDSGDRQTLVVVGNGMMSHRLCRRLVECGAAEGPLRVVVLGEEPRPAYDRIRLTELFAGRTEEDLCLAPASWYLDHGIDLRLGDPVVTIDRSECEVRSASGASIPYDRLVLATGSRPFVPPVPGTDLPGVFVYRTVDDLRAILSHARGAARAAVVGGGLLGLEAARAVRDLGLEVHVIEASRGLLPRQLDETGARLLREKVEALGVRVHTGARTARIEDAGRERGLCLSDGSRLTVDLVVLSAGIRPRGELGQASGLEVASDGGVVIDDHLQSSDPRIFAVGECATHRGATYGLALPGYRMIDVLVDNLVGGDAVFEGADRSARLKLLGVSVAALGRYEEAPETQTHVYLAGGVYRKLLARDGRIVGAVAVGEWDDLPRVSDAIDAPRGLSFWDLRRFRSTGTLWLKSESPPVHEWPAEALVCGCLGVRRGALTEAEMAGCATAEALSARTGAGTMCGSCRPLLAELVRRGRIDSLPPPRLEHEADEPPATLRCSIPPEVPGPVEVPPRSTRSPVFLQAVDAALFVSAPAARAELATLPSIDVEPVSTDAAAREAMRWPRPEAVTRHAPEGGQAGRKITMSLPVLPPGCEPPASSRRPDSIAPSSRRDSMAPLRPISVPPSRISGLPSGRLAPSIGPPAVDRWRGALLATAAAALGGSAALVLVPAVPPARSFRGFHVEALWTHRASKQASGYAVVALALAGLVLTLRKRWKRFSYGDVAGLRVLHGALGAAALAALACHTGLHAGERLNRVLSLDFLAASALGGVAAAAAALGDPRTAPARRLLVSRAHVCILLPLPVLVVLHVLGAYWF